MTPANDAPPNRPTRTDLTYLRRRTRPTAQQVPAESSRTTAAPQTSVPSPSGGSVADFLAGRSTRPGRQRLPAPDPAAPPPPARPAAAPPAGGGLLDLGGSSSTPRSAPDRGSLDLGSSGAPATSSRSIASGGSSLDLDLDLALDLDSRSSVDLGPGDGSHEPIRHVREKADDLRLPTISEHERRVLGVADRVVHLTRIQSAVGRLRVEPALGAGEHVDLGCALETADRQESIVLGTLNRQGPDPRRPMVRCGGHGVEVDLRRIHSLSRLLIVAVGGRLPGGTLVISTYGGSRMEIPLRNGPTLGAQALLTGYVVQGRLVLRAELDPFSGTLQQVCGAYGYTELTWRDPGTPLI